MDDGSGGPVAFGLAVLLHPAAASAAIAAPTTAIASLRISSYLPVACLPKWVPARTRSWGDTTAGTWRTSTGAGSADPPGAGATLWPRAHDRQDQLTLPGADDPSQLLLDLDGLTMPPPSAVTALRLWRTSQGQQPGVPLAPSPLGNARTRRSWASTAQSRAEPG